MEADVAPGVEPAILIRGVSKQYGNNRKVLDDLDMTVLKGTIYALLGASGCGKTTLLGSILGAREIQNGAISILGKPPEVIPIESIGYMPQDIALTEEFTIKQVFQHAGWMLGMTSEQIKERHLFCEKLLDLPPGNKLIKNLSGGQQRRVSLGVVLIQDPELLILDEPTVGLDPVLRQNLWDYLIKITKEDKRTVVITTHYIEEARQADMLGLLRHGKMLAEGKPEVLMDQFECPSLETLFALLSSKQNDGDPSIGNRQQQSLIIESKVLNILNQKPPRKSLWKKICFINRNHAKSLVSRNFIRYVRDPSTLLMALILPMIQINAVFLAIGKIPEDLNIGIVNQELGDYKTCEDFINDGQFMGGEVVDEFKTCVYAGLGCKFVKTIQNFVKYPVYFQSQEEVLQAANQGKISQILFFNQNYSEAFTALNNFDDILPEDLNASTITYQMDVANNPIGLFVGKELHQSYIKFAEELAIDCKWNPRSTRFPLLFNQPIYGKADFSFGEFIAPAIMIMVGMGVSEALAISTIITERRGGVWERTIVSGIQPAEIIICHVAALSFTSMIQTLECFFFAIYVFGLECKGNLIYAVLLLYLEGLLGIALGIFISVFAQGEREAFLTGIGLFVPLIMLSGFVWPVEGMPRYLQYVSYVMPTTIPIQAVNNVIFRGWDISNFHVYKGCLSAGSYICLLTISSALGLKFEKK